MTYQKQNGLTELEIMRCPYDTKELARRNIIREGCSVSVMVVGGREYQQEFANEALAIEAMDLGWIVVEWGWEEVTM